MAVTAMRAINVLAMALVVVLTAGCSKWDKDAFAREVVAAVQEEVRQELAQKLGPTVLASLVGASAPPCGPLCLLATDAGWQEWADAGIAEHDADGTPYNGLPVGFRMFYKAPPHDPGS